MAGFVSLNPVVWLGWMSLFATTGFLCGRELGWPVIGVAVGVAAGLLPAGRFGIAAHYGGAPWAYAGIPMAVAVGVVNEWWLGVVGVGLVYAYLVVALVRARMRKTRVP
jgi:hypothetical protein